MKDGVISHEANVHWRTLSPNSDVRSFFCSMPYLIDLKKQLGAQEMFMSRVFLPPKLYVAVWESRQQTAAEMIHVGGSRHSSSRPHHINVV